MDKVETKNFRLELALLNMTAGQFARKVGYTRRYICRILRGKKPVSKEVLNRLNRLKKAEYRC